MSDQAMGGQAMGGEAMMGPVPAAPAGDNAFAGPTAGRLAALSPQARAAAAQRMEILGALGRGLAGRPYGERRAVLAHLAPALARLGLPPDAVAGFDPTDDALAAATAESDRLRAMLGG